MSLTAIGASGSSASLSANRRLNNSLSTIRKKDDELSSGRRKLNAAELAIAEQLSAEAATSSVAARNISDGVSVANVADGALSSASDITTRLSELATQAANGTISDDQRAALNNEFQQLTAELDRISQTTEFNGQQLLSADSQVNIQAGTDSSPDSQVSIGLPGVSAASLGITADLSSAASAQQALDQTRAAGDTVASARGEIGASVSRLETSFNNIKVAEENIRASESRIADADVAKSVADRTAAGIRAQASVSTLQLQNNLSRDTVLKLLG